MRRQRNVYVVPLDKDLTAEILRDSQPGARSYLVTVLQDLLDQVRSIVTAQAEFGDSPPDPRYMQLWITTVKEIANLLQLGTRVPLPKVEEAAADPQEEARRQEATVAGIERELREVARSLGL
jgi:hypothetical protein